MSGLRHQFSSRAVRGQKLRPPGWCMSAKSPGKNPVTVDCRPGMAANPSRACFQALSSSYPGFRHIRLPNRHADGDHTRALVLPPANLSRGKIDPTPIHRACRPTSGASARTWRRRRAGAKVRDFFPPMRCGKGRSPSETEVAVTITSLVQGRQGPSRRRHHRLPPT